MDWLEKKRFRDRVMASLPMYREGDDLETYLATIESSYRKVRVPVEEWMFHVRGRLTGRVLTYWSENC